MVEVGGDPEVVQCIARALGDYKTEVLNTSPILSKVLGER
jgi:hypothetical protein